MDSSLVVYDIRAVSDDSDLYLHDFHPDVSKNTT